VWVRSSGRALTIDYWLGDEESWTIHLLSVSQWCFYEWCLETFHMGLRLWSLYLLGVGWYTIGCDGVCWATFLVGVVSGIYLSHRLTFRFMLFSHDCHICPCQPKLRRNRGIWQRILVWIVATHVHNRLI
jgi:hypothetical protein